MGYNILELGAGEGGPHYLNPCAQYFAVDNNFEALVQLRRKYPGVITVNASAQNIPFPDSIFNRVEVRFPFMDLLTPGLQQDNPFGSLVAKLGFKVPASREDRTWYGEFSRVLQLNGSLGIWADSCVNIGQVRSSASVFFREVSTTELTIEDFKQMDTSLVRRRLKHIMWGFPSSTLQASPVYRIEFAKI